MGQIEDQARANDAATWSLAFPGEQRPWQEMWALIEYNLRRLESRYAGPKGADGMIGLKNDVYNFFIACYHLTDHLQHDPAVPENVQEAVRNYVQNKVALTLAGDLVNTFKHHTRRNSTDLSVRITRLSSTPTATIGWTEPVKGERQRDALELAKTTVQDWRSFLDQHGLL